MGQPFVKPLASRGDGDETEDPGTEMENSIDFSRFHVVFYDAIIVWLESCKTWCSFIWAVISTG